MKFLTMLLMVMVVLFLYGCAGKGLKVEVETPEKKIHMTTDYQIENGFKMSRNMETGEYEIELGSATTKDAEMGVIVELLRMVQQLMGGAAPQPPAQD